MRISGVDLGARKASVATILVTAEGEKSLSDVMSVIAHPTTRPDELKYVANAVCELVSHSNYVFIEEPLVGRGVKASMSLSQTAGAIMARLAEENPTASVQMVNVKVWKKKIIGNGNAGKHDIKLWLEEHYPGYSDECGTDQDAIDACCVALFGVHALEILEEYRSVSGE